MQGRDDLHTPAVRQHVTRVALHDANPVYGRALSSLLGAAEDVDVGGPVATHAELVELCARTRPDCVVLDCDALAAETAGAIRNLRSRYGVTRVIGLHNDTAVIDPATDAAGIDVVLHRADGINPVVAAVRGCGAGVSPATEVEARSLTS
jgi:DNA-binding NarL/FixJ family response regulator